MAQKVQVLLIDDLDGGEADETVSFSYGGSSYEIDLSNGNASKLRDALKPFVDNARKRSATRRRSPAASSRARSTDIRAWAKSRGIKVNERGRIPASVVEQYDATH
jgi:hypothetical protein